VLARLCPACGKTLDQATVPRGPCPECQRERDRRRYSTARKARSSSAWQQVREKAKRRDGHRCRQCGSSENLEAHHVRGLAEGGSAFTLDNVITLCAACHRKESSEGGFLGDAAHTPPLASRERIARSPEPVEKTPSIG
jgi:5-methylcytosine-specific restriction endonuclease McrA